MKKPMKWIIIPLSAALLLVGCKSKAERLGDESLAADRLTNAITFYTKAEKAGDVSEEFKDNFALAYLRMAAKTAKKDPLSNVVRSYIEQINKLVLESKNPKVIEEYVTTLASIGAIQITADGEYGTILEGFSNIKNAEDFSAKNGKVGSAAIQASRNQAESKYVAGVLKNASDIENSIAKEYELLLAEVVAPDNAELKAALNTTHKKNRGDFLIFEAAGVESPSRWVNKYGYVTAFPSISISGTETKGEMQFWNSSGNNTELDGSLIKLVSTTGQETPNKGANTGWCSGNNPLKPTKEKLVAGKGKLLDEGTCSIAVSFSYGSDFTPDYVEYKDQFGVGRKYLGQ